MRVTPPSCVHQVDKKVTATGQTSNAFDLQGAHLLCYAVNLPDPLGSGPLGSQRGDGQSVLARVLDARSDPRASDPDVGGQALSSLFQDGEPRDRDARGAPALMLPLSAMLVGGSVYIIARRRKRGHRSHAIS